MSIEYGLIAALMAAVIIGVASLIPDTREFWPVSTSVEVETVECTTGPLTCLVRVP